MNDNLIKLIGLLEQRNAIDAQIAALIGRPALQGHIGEFIAAELFDIELDPSACNAGFDGRFRSGELVGKTVNIKLYGKQESLLGINEACLPDFYLVLTGAKGNSSSSRGKTRPLRIQRVYLFDAAELIAALRGNGVKIGIATSVRKAAWERAEIFPVANNSRLVPSAQQISLLRRFANGSTSVAT